MEEKKGQKIEIRSEEVQDILGTVSELLGFSASAGKAMAMGYRQSKLRWFRAGPWE